MHPPLDFYQNAIPFPEQAGNFDRIAYLFFLCYDKRRRGREPVRTAGTRLANRPTNRDL